MNLPNKITLLRIIFAPVFLTIFALANQINNTITNLILIILIWLLFWVIELSDLFDGLVARKLNQGSDLGKLLDPFADSFSRITYFFCFLLAGIMPFWVFIIILYRDMLVSFFRQYLSTKKVVLSAKWSGKVKAWFYAIGGFCGIFYFSCKKLLIFINQADIIYLISQIVFGMCALIALYSFIDYLIFFVKNSKNNK